MSTNYRWLATAISIVFVVALLGALAVWAAPEIAQILEAGWPGICQVTDGSVCK